MALNQMIAGRSRTIAVTCPLPVRIVGLDSSGFERTILYLYIFKRNLIESYFFIQNYRSNLFRYLDGLECSTPESNKTSSLGNRILA